MEDPRVYLVRAIAARLPACSTDELRVIDQLLAGIERGRAVYGPLDLGRDARDFAREAADELRDCLFYLCAHSVAELARCQVPAFELGGES